MQRVSLGHAPRLEGGSASTGGGIRTHTVADLNRVPPASWATPAGRLTLPLPARRSGCSPLASDAVSPIPVLPQPVADSALGNPSLEIFNRLLKDRIVILGTEVSDDIANIIC